MLGLLAQIKAFALTLILGIFTGIIFHYYNLMVGRAGIRKYWLYILDFALWIIIVVTVFISMLFINQGEMRVYVLIALMTGIFIYYHYFASRLEILLSPAARVTVNTFSNFIKGVKKAASRCLHRIKAIAKHKTPPSDDPPLNGGGVQE